MATNATTRIVSVGEDEKVPESHVALFIWPEFLDLYKNCSGACPYLRGKSIIQVATWAFTCYAATRAGEHYSTRARRPLLANISRYTMHRPKCRKMAAVELTRRGTALVNSSYLPNDTEHMIVVRDIVRTLTGFYVLLAVEDWLSKKQEC